MTKSNFRQTIKRLDSKMKKDVEMGLDDLGPFDDAEQRAEAFSAILQMANEGKVYSFVLLLYIV